MAVISKQAGLDRVNSDLQAAGRATASERRLIGKTTAVVGTALAAVPAAVAGGAVGAYNGLRDSVRPVERSLTSPINGSLTAQASAVVGGSLVVAGAAAAVAGYDVTLLGAAITGGVAAITTAASLAAVNGAWGLVRGAFKSVVEGGVGAARLAGNKVQKGADIAGKWIADTTKDVLRFGKKVADDTAECVEEKALIAIGATAIAVDAVGDVGTAIGKDIVKAADCAIDVVGDVGTAVGKDIACAVDAVGDVGTAIGKDIVHATAVVVDTVGDVGTAIGKDIVHATAVVVDTVGDVGTAIGKDIVKAADCAVDATVQAGKDTVEFVGDVGTNIGLGAKEVVEDGLAAVGKGLKGAGSAASKAADDLNGSSRVANGDKEPAYKDPFKRGA